MKGAKKIYGDTYLIADDAFGFKVYSYLLVGAETALLIDTGYGNPDYIKIAAGITDKPITAVNSHGHLDHIGGNAAFSEVYLHPADNKVYEDNTERNYIAGLIDKMLFFLPRKILDSRFVGRLKEGFMKTRRVKLLPMPEAFELGGRRVSVILTPGHTKGCVCFLDEKNKVLFSGDTVCDIMILLYFEHSTDVKTFRESINKLQALKESGAYNIIYPAHHKYPLDTGYVSNYLELCDLIISGKGNYKRANSGWPSYRTKYKGISIFHMDKDN